MRIVSLLPSATEIVCAIGLEANLVGVTHECDWPPSVKLLPKVTRTLIPHDASGAEIDRLVREQLGAKSALYTLDMDLLERLRPDLLITQALCDVCAVPEAEVTAAACALPGQPVVVNLEPMTLEEVLGSMIEVGRAAGCEAAALAAVAKLRARISTVERVTAEISAAAWPRVAFLEWIDPLFNGGHWNPGIIQMAGGIDLLGNPGRPSRTVSHQELCDSMPEVIFVACCGFSTARALQDLGALQRIDGWMDLPAVQNGRIYFTDGAAYFSRPGPRLVDSLEILAHALHPEEHSLPPGLPAAEVPPYGPED
ncbi:MAG: cobalamin-binding protein [Armatimonadetes bacterium]|nr:cobalamin-binding protein [Armatimonadota bacterium]MDE2205837.1 cobalamin-binding protein [Armatimonadota bacterium]